MLRHVAVKDAAALVAIGGSHRSLIKVSELAELCYSGKSKHRLEEHFRAQRPLTKLAAPPSSVKQRVM
jgi:hypothetical protein